MFGGAGIYAQETMFALLHDGVIYLKADTQNAPAFAAEDLSLFSSTTWNGERAVMSDPAHAAAPLRLSRRACGLGLRGSGGGRLGAVRECAPAGRKKPNSEAGGSSRPSGGLVSASGSQLPMTWLRPLTLGGIEGRHRRATGSGLADRRDRQERGDADRQRHSPRYALVERFGRALSSGPAGSSTG